MQNVQVTNQITDYRPPPTNNRPPTTLPITDPTQYMQDVQLAMYKAELAAGRMKARRPRAVVVWAGSNGEPMHGSATCSTAAVWSAA